MKRNSFMVINKKSLIFLVILFFGASFVLAEKDFEVDNVLLKLVLKEGDFVSKSLTISSSGDFDFEVDKGDMDFVEVESSFSLGEGEKKVLEINFNGVGKEPGVYLGKLRISNGESIFVPVVLEIESKEVFFDGSLSVPLEYVDVSPGNNLVVENKIFNLENVDSQNVDVSYFVKGFDGKIIFLEEENIRIENQVLNTKVVSIGEDVEIGDYLFVSIVKKDDSVGTSSYFFKVKEKVVEEKENNFFMWIVILALIGLLFFIVYYNKKKDDVLLRLQSQYKDEVLRQKAKGKGKDVRKKLKIVKKIYRNRVKVVKRLKRKKKVSEAEKKLAEWKKQGYNVDEFFVDKKESKKSLKDKVRKFRKQGYKI